jgi:predicted nucleic acid-binding protein
VILVDSNILMYAAGAAHPHKAPSVALLERVAAGQVSACVSVEVLQEVLHRYRALDRWSDGRRVYELTRQIVPTVIPVTVAMLDRARDILDATPGIMARDAVHAAVVQLESLAAICSYDRDFDRIAELRRVQPDNVP